MAILNMQAAEQALKTVYLPALRYQLNVANPILAVVERDSESVVGAEAFELLIDDLNGRRFVGHRDGE